MILIDTNILIYAHVNSFAQHNRAREWLDQQLNAAAFIGLPVGQHAHIPTVLVTNPCVFQHPESMRDAWKQVCTWLSSETAWVPQPTERHAELLDRFLAVPGVHGNLVPDAHLAALAVEHGLTLCSTDGDFARFQ